MLRHVAGGAELRTSDDATVAVHGEAAVAVNGAVAVDDTVADSVAIDGAAAVDRSAGPLTAEDNNIYSPTMLEPKVSRQHVLPHYAGT